uniref:Uncharacterized protein n=1 Tax=Rhizophora mucronata TaxID=61149 RepID=A0A2P2ITU5_RHIMU
MKKNALCRHYMLSILICLSYAWGYFRTSAYIFFKSGDLSSTVGLLFCDQKVTSLSHGKSFCKMQGACVR